MQVFITFYCVVAELERYICVVGWRSRGGCTETFGSVLYNHLLFVYFSTLKKYYTLRTSFFSQTKSMIRSFIFGHQKFHHTSSIILSCPMCPAIFVSCSDSNIL